MPKNWDEIDMNEMLNFYDAHTGKMAQYGRIMQHQLTKSVSFLSEKLTGVMETIYRAHQGFEKKTDELQNSYTEISQKQIESYKQIAESQSRLQKWIIALTFIIAFSTVAYVFITWKSVSAMKESNEIQGEFLAIERIKLKSMQNNNIKVDMRQRRAVGN